MNMHHDMADEAAPVDDLSTLAWVHEELRRSLEAAHKSLRRYLKETDARAGSDVDAVDPSVLRAARAQLHQGVGALEMIGLHGPARVLRASESAVQRFIAKPKPLTSAAVEAIESASFGVLDYLSRKLAGKGLPTLALFPQYRALLELAGADRVHPADLWRDEWQWHEVPADASVAPLAADVAARSAMETQVLAIMRANDRGAMARLSDLCAGLAASSSGHLSGLWKLSAAFYRGPGRGFAATRCVRQTGQFAAAGAVALEHCGAARGFAASGAGRAVLLRACARARRRARRAATAGRARGLRGRCRCGLRLPGRAPGPLRPGLDRTGAQARGRRQGSLVCRGRWRSAPHDGPGRAVRAGRRLAQAPVSVGRGARRRAAGRGEPDPGQSAAHRRLRWRWKSPPASSTWTPRSRTASSTIPWWRRACSAWRSASSASARATTPSRSSRGWRSCTAVSPTARPWAAWCRNCAPRCPRSRSRSTSTSATRRSARC